LNSGGQNHVAGGRGRTKKGERIKDDNLVLAYLRRGEATGKD